MRNLTFSVLALVFAACLAQSSHAAMLAGQTPEPPPADGAKEDSGPSAGIEADFAAPLRPALDDEIAVVGPGDAPITIVMYSEPGCPYSKQAWFTILGLVKLNNPHVNLVYKTFFVHDVKDGFQDVAVAARHIEAVKATYSVHSPLYIEGLLDSWPSPMSHAISPNPDPQPQLQQLADRFGFDQAQLKQASEAPAVDEKVQRDHAEAVRFGFSGAPAFTINGVRMTGAHPPEQFQAVIDRWKAQLDLKE